jgi:hypothetical protein
MMTKGIIVARRRIHVRFDVWHAAKVAQSDNDRASNPTIRTMALQY